MRIAVVGAGSAGVITTAQLCAHVPAGSKIINIYDPNTKILGIGESTNSSVISVLEKACHFNFLDDLLEMDSTLKFGNKFIGWRDHEWLSPLLDGGIAIHINNFKLRDFVHTRCHKYWPDKFSVVEGLVDDIVNDDTCATVVINGQAEKFDYVVDTRGFPKDWTGYHMVDSLPINRAIINTVYAPGNWQYTEHRATPNGWQFGVPLQHRRTYGYLFNDTITSVEAAYEDFARFFDANVKDIGRLEGQTEYQFKPYYVEKVLEGRVFKNGNRAIFFEPISASSIYFYVFANQLFIAHLKGGKTKDQINSEFVDYAQQLESLICYMYHGGSTYDTPFWRYAKENTRKHLFKSEHFRKVLLDCWIKGQAGLPHAANPWIFNGHHLHVIDEKFAYNYFTDKGKNRAALAEIDANLAKDKSIDMTDHL